MSKVIDLQQLLPGDYVVEDPCLEKWKKAWAALINSLCDKVENDAKILVDSIPDNDIRERAANNLFWLCRDIHAFSYDAFKMGKSWEEYEKTVLKVVEEIDPTKAKEGKYVELLRFLDKMYDRIHSFLKAE